MQSVQISGGGLIHEMRRDGASIAQVEGTRSVSFTFRARAEAVLPDARSAITSGGRIVRARMDTFTEIRKRRVALGISLGELARAVGRSDATLSRIERGRIRPSYDLVQHILSYLEAQEGFAAPRLTVGELMNRALVTIESSATLATAAQRLEGGAFSQLPGRRRREGRRLPFGIGAPSRARPTLVPAGPGAGRAGTRVSGRG